MTKQPIIRSDEPLYMQLCQLLEDQITNGTLKQGDQIMTEAELSEYYQVSRITVRKAIEVLVQKGVLVKQRGIGTFVAKTKMLRNMSGILGFSASCRQIGKEPSSKLLVAELRPSTVKDREYLKLGTNSTIICIIRIRMCDSTPVIIEEVHYPQEYAYLLAYDLQGSLYDALAEHGIIPSKGMSTLSIVLAGHEDANQLQIEDEKPLLQMEGVVYDENKEPIHYSRQLINLDKYKMNIVQ